MELKSIEPLILTESDILSVAPSLMDIIGIVEDTYAMDARGEVEVPAKIGVHPDYERSFLHAMPAWVSGRRMTEFSSSAS